MTTDGAGLVNAFNGAREEMGNVAALKNEKNDPVDTGNDVIHSKCRVVVVVLSPDPAPRPDAIVGAVECIVKRDNDGEKPGYDGQDLIRDDAVLGMGFALSEWID